MKSIHCKPALIGGAVGLADGLLFVTCIHTGLDFLAPVLFYPAYPCWWVTMKVSAWLPLPEWLAWGLGVLSLVLIGALAGLTVGHFRRRAGAR